MFFKPITISLSPNTERDDVIIALKELLTPWHWYSGEAKDSMRKFFEQTFKTSNIFFYNSGRSALVELLSSFGIGDGDEVVVQAFTCVAVPNAVLWTGAQPIYADIDKSYNLNETTIQKVITKKTKAIIVQHTFGIPAEIDSIMSLAKKYDLFVIEDCAHAFGASYKGKLLGTYGDAAFFSFGRDKVLSSVFGGVAIVHKQTLIAQKLERRLQQLTYPGYHWTFQQLLHPIVMNAILPLYSIGIGKMILVILQKLSLLSFPVYKEEKCGIQPLDFPRKYPPTLMRLAINQLKKLHRYNTQRQRIANYYRSALTYKKNTKIVPEVNGAIYLRFPILVDNPEAVIQKAKEMNILLGNWYHNVVDPKGVDLKHAQYNSSRCPEAEFSSKHIVNLPTRISLSEAKKVVSVLQ